MDPRHSPDPGATEKTQREDGRASPRKRQTEQRQYAENEGLVNKGSREAGALDTKESEALGDARVTSQRGRTA